MIMDREALGGPDARKEIKGGFPALKDATRLDGEGGVQGFLPGKGAFPLWGNRKNLKGKEDTRSWSAGGFGPWEGGLPTKRAMTKGPSEGERGGGVHGVTKRGVRGELTAEPQSP